MPRKFHEIKIHLQCLKKFQSFPTDSQKCLLLAFKNLKNGKLDIHRFYFGKVGGNLRWAEACGFRIYLSMKAGSIAIIDISPSGGIKEG